MTATLDPDDDLASRYATEAVESGVLDRDGETIGHVGLLDVDETTLDAARIVAERLPGPVAVLRSSERSYHLWDLSVASWRSWIERVDRLDDVVDSEHIALSSSRGCSVLRIDAKVRLGDGAEVKPSPTLVRIVDGDAGPVSDPHADLLRERFDAEDLDDLLDDVETVGASLDRRTYMADLGGRE